MKIYLAGGAVRDGILGQCAHDNDYVVINGSAEEFLQSYPNAKRVGKEVCTFIVRGEEYTLSDAPDIENDLLSRDLTVNALAQDEAGTLYAHPTALDDLKQKILRPAGEGNFRRDPNRVFRAARFWSCFPEYELSDTLLRTMMDARERDLLKTVAAERVGGEVLKNCACGVPSRFLELLARTECLLPWFLEFVGAPQLVEQTGRVMDRLQGKALRTWMGWCHALDEAGAQALGERLKLPTKFIKAGALCASCLDDLSRYAELVPEDKVDLLVQLYKHKLANEMLELVRVVRERDVREMVLDDLERVMCVSLPKTCRNKGPESGQILRMLRVRAIS